MRSALEERTNHIWLRHGGHDGYRLDSGFPTRGRQNPYAELTSSAAWYGTDSLLTARYDRDALGRITRIVETTAAGTTDRGYHYFHDRGQLEAVRDSLTHVDIARYRYDANGNRLGLLTATDSMSAAYDAQDRLVDRGTAHYTYTANGERLTRTQSGATVSTTYDLLGNLVQVKLASGDSVEYVVDGRNRRVGRKFNGTLTARWVYANDLSVVGELDTVGVLTKRFVYASSSHVPDLMVVRNPSGPDSTYRFVTDHLGSVRLVVNANTGFVAQRLAYDAWGVVTLDTRPGFTPFGYAGGLYDPATALVRFGARDYDPDAGVWTSKDPVGFGGRAANLLAYCASDPVNHVDASGLLYADELPSHSFGKDGTEEGGYTVPGTLEITGQAFAAFVDGVIPFVNPLQDAGVYRPTKENGLCWSQNIGGWTRDIEASIALTIFGNSPLVRNSKWLGENSPLFGQSAGLLNRGNVVRVGWGGKKGVSDSFFRIVIGSRKWPLPFFRHLDIR